ncbi:MAG: L-fucose isomerase-like protein [Akkermansiaceae bacterium]
MRIGILALGRPTFDVAFAEEKLSLMLAALDQTGHDIIGPRVLLLDEAATRAAMADLDKADLDQVLILQVTFTDASITVAVAGQFTQPLSIWAVPEPRLGGRLRLNAFCGLNLASHALSLNDRGFSWLYADPAHDVGDDLAALFSGGREAGRLEAISTNAGSAEGTRVVAAMKGRKIACIGKHPVGFDTCAYSADTVKTLTGVTVDALALDDLFDTARAVPAADTNRLRAIVQTQVDGLGDVAQDQLDRSLSLKGGLETLRERGDYDAFAIRCWPETFTEYGGAVCGPAAMMGEARVPCACEADVYGALTQLVLQEAANAPVFLTDLVDIDVADNTGLVWHCGQAPLSMRDDTVQPKATVHTNRRQPLLYQFPLKPGPVTFLRISQSYNTPKMILGYGQMLRRPMAFTGTSGVVQFSRPAEAVLGDIFASGLEHHMALAYGDHRDTLRAVATELGLPVLEL